MKRLEFKKTLTSLIVVFALTVFSMPFVSAQDNMQSKYMISELERLQDENMDYLNQIYRIVKDYPAFSYSYKMENGKVTDVVVNGVDNDLDQKRLEVVLFDLKSNKNMIKDKANRIGVFYSTDKDAQYESGYESLSNNVLSKINYPYDAKTWPVEGTIFVKFVVDENGEIPFATTSEDIDTEMDMYVDDLEKQAVSAVESTSGKWQPAEIEGEEVASLVVLPVTFNFKKDPTLPALIR